ncbi:hypothetical protein [uncultured Dietzia sp.]|nr:hypothetical protein [uncultured Dietzia sp.]
MAPARFCANVADRAASLTAVISAAPTEADTADNEPADIVVIIATPAAR